MLIQHTLDRLREMGLHGMAQALDTQRTHPDVQGLAFEDRVGLLVDQEWTLRQNRRLTRLLQEAKLRYPAACLEDVDYHHPRGLDRGLLRSLGTGEWIRAHQVVLISGPTGVGKSWIGCALGNAACRQGFSTRYYRVPRLLSDLALAHADGSYPRVLARLADPTVADAILDRLVHHAHTLVLKGESMRKVLEGGASKSQRQGGEALPRRR